jgi:aspartate racemase
MKQKAQHLVPGFIGMATPANAVYLQVFESTGSRILDAQGSPNRLRAVLMEIDFALLVEHVKAADWAAAERQIADAATALERGGADFLVITSNTGATLDATARRETGLPVIDIVATTLAELAAAGRRRPGLLSTVRTYESGVYHRAAAALGIELVAAPHDRVRAIEKVIFEELIFGRVTDTAFQAVRAAIDYFVIRGADSIVLACTDLTHVAARLHEMSPLRVFDSTTIHAEAAAAVACGELALRR